MDDHEMNRIGMTIAKMLSRLALLQQVRALTHPQRVKILRELLELEKDLPREAVDEK